jgi:O-acetyl-ADP-ribose deacetylase (regulator of RNase III)
MKIILCDTKKDMTVAWHKVFARLIELGYDVEIVQGSIVHQQVDAIVAPGNSFGFMSDGLDKVILNYLGESIQDSVQFTIKQSILGELVVGDAIVVPTQSPRIPQVIYAPTMRVPTRLPKDTTNVYLATLAGLVRAVEYNFTSVAISGMGTGYGNVSVEVCANQMYFAYAKHFIGLPCPTNINEAKIRHRHLFIPPL